MDHQPEQKTDRRQALAVLARANSAELAAAWEALSDAPAIETLREPEIGLVMARGRVGGGGAAFNLGEVTVSRATVRLASGEVGIGHVMGRDTGRALMVARFDALWQSPGHRGWVETAVVAPVSQRLAKADAETRAKAAATRVNFFTMVRGEDA